MKAENQALRGFDAIIGGYLGGISSILIGSPLDVIKIRLQVQSSHSSAYSGPFDCAKKILSQEGFFAFYRGAIFPIMSVGFMMSANVNLFSTYKSILPKLTGHRKSHSIHDFLSGGLAGATTSVISTPFDHLKVRMQTQIGSVASVSNSVTCFKEIALRYGLRGVYTGLTVTVMRNFIGYACSFGGYEQIKNNIFQGSQGGLLQPIVCGSLAGSLFWVFSYPFDSIKSLIQADSFEKPKYKGIIDCYAKTVKHEGHRVLFRGLTPTILRSMPTTAGFWVTYEFVRSVLNKPYKKTSPMKT